MGIKQLYNDNLRKLKNEYGDVSVIGNPYVKSGLIHECLVSHTWEPLRSLDAKQTDTRSPD